MANKGWGGSAEGESHSYKVGLRNVGSYQVSGTPWITGSTDIDNGAEHHHQFPFVTKAFTVLQRGTGELRIHFASKDTNPGVYNDLHFIKLDGDEESITLNVKCKEVFISAVADNSAYDLIAELTNIPTGSMFTLTGSGITEDTTV